MKRILFALLWSSSVFAQTVTIQSIKADLEVLNTKLGLYMAAIPETWTQCASQYGTCAFTGTRVVRYGTPSVWMARELKDGTPCTNAVFTDPAPGKEKVCQLRDLPISVVMPTPTPTPAPTPTPVPVTSFVPAGYDLVFGDDFGQTKLDITKWWTRYIYSGGTLDFVNAEVERYRENGNHVLANGVLSLVAKKDASVSTGYSSGMIRSKSTFKYGYFEGRFKFASGKGFWPAFWLNSDSSADGKTSWPPEVDIFEFVNNGVTEFPDMLHMNAVDGGGQGRTDISNDPLVNTQWSFYKSPVDLTLDWHTVGLLWDTDDTLSYYLDGKLIRKQKYKWVYNTGVTAPNAHVLVNFALGDWAGKVDDTKLPGNFQVDYIRVYQKVGAHQVGTSTIGQDLLK